MSIGRDFQTEMHERFEARDRVQHVAEMDKVRKDGGVGEFGEPGAEPVDLKRGEIDDAGGSLVVA